MALSYIGANQPVTAAKMNELWAEFDRKMSLVMNGKSWLLFQGLSYGPEIEKITGKRFYFTNLTTWGRIIDIAGAASPNYDHTVFTADVAAATESGTWDHPNKIVSLTGFSVDLDNSLEAHKKETLNGDGDPEDYWVWQDGAVMPQRLHRFAVAELIFEDDGAPAVTIPKEYSKFQFFRLHNLNAFTLEVTFEALPGQSDLVINVPAYGCKTAQRRPAGQLQVGYNYFWKFLPGDPRSLTTKDFGGNPATDTMRVNNVWNPALLYEIIELFSAYGALGDASNPCRIIRDPHIVYEIDDLYPAYFADPAVTTNLLGDILHHKGEVHYNYRNTSGTLQRVVSTFNGYGDLASLTSMGLTVSTSGTGVSVQGTLGSEFNDIVTPGSNLLFGDAGEVVTAAEISTARDIEHKQPVAYDPFINNNEFFRPVFITTGTLTGDYRAYSVDADGVPSLGSVVSVDHDLNTIDWLGPDATDILVPHADTIADALLFNTFGLIALSGTNQDSDVATLENRRIVMTIFGPLILWEQKYTFGASAFGGTGIGFEVTPGRPYSELNGLGQLVEHRYMVWGGYGWPDYPARDPISGEYNGSHGGFIGPRKARAINALSGGYHPNYQDEVYGPDGADFRVIAAPATQTAARLLFTPGYASPGACHMPIWSAADQLYEYELATVEADYVTLRGTMQGEGVTTPWMPRVKMLREHYNTMAAYVNSCVKARPFCWSDFRHYLPATTEDGYGVPVVATDRWDRGIANAGTPGNGNLGILGTTIRPIDQYAAFASGSFLHHLFTTLGVTIKTEADLPSSFTSALSDLSDYVYWDGTYDQVIDSATLISGTNYHYKFHYEMTAEAHHTAAGGGAPNYYKIGLFNANLVFDAENPSYPDTGIPNDDTIVVEYLWVTIADVKAAAEALGFLFIFEELSIPVVMEEFTIGDTYTVKTDTSVFQYFDDDTGGPPHATGVFDSGTWTTVSGQSAIESTRVRFIDKTSGAEWKRDWIAAAKLTVADVVPADVLVISMAFIDAVLIGDGAELGFYAKLDCTDEYRAHARDLRQTVEETRHASHYQISASTGYTIAGGVFQIPRPWFTHASDDWSDVSDDNLRARWALGNQVYEFEASGNYGSETPAFFSSGSNFIPAWSGEAFEQVIWRDNYVDLT